MSKYQSDQFFNIGGSRPSQWSRNVSGNDNTRFVNPNALNDDFLFPDKTIRHIKPSFDGKTWSEDTAILQKGYIRRINEFNDSNEGPLLCRFQFNPQFINQAASFQSGMVNPIYQPIEQLQQPIASMTNFSFRLIFDRSMEINQESTDVLIRTTDNPWETGDPRQVGVLHDINALFRVIGQGISADDVEGAINRATEAFAATDQRIGKDELTDEETKTYTEAVSNSSRFFQNNVNVGNTAFILPYPVRIVFSSLYIVEGFITQTSLEILKFSSSYVPMMAQVTMSVNAVYIGFAKRNTYFTHVLEQSAVERRNSIIRTAETQAAEVALVKEMLSTLNVKLGRRDVRPNNRAREFIGTGNGTPVIRFNQLFNDVNPPSGFAYTNPRVWASPTDFTDPRAWEEFRSFSFRKNRSSQSQDDAIFDLFTEGQLTMLKFRWKTTLFGPFADTRGSSGRGGFDDFSFTSADDVRNNTILSAPGIAQRSSNEQFVTVTTKSQWQNLHKPDLSRSSTADPEPSALPFTLNLPSQFSSSLDQTRRWVLLVEGSYEVTLNSNTYLDSSFSVLTLNRNSQAFLSTTLNFLWSRYDIPDTATSTVGTGGGSGPGDVAAIDASWVPPDFSVIS